MTSYDLYIRLLGYLKPYRSGFALAIVSIALLALTEPVMPYLMQPLIDDGFGKQQSSLWYWVPLAIVGLYFLRAIFTFSGRYLMAWVAQKIVMDIRNQVFSKLLVMPQHFFSQNPAGKLISKITYNVTQVAEASTDLVVVLVRDALTVLGLTAFLIYLNWKLSLFIVIVIPFIAVLLKIVARRMRGLSHSTQDNMGTITHILEEAINGSRVIKIFAGFAYENQRFRQISNAIRRFAVKTVSASAASVSVLHLINACAVALIIWFALYEASLGRLTQGSFVAFITALGLLWSPIKRLTELNEKLQRGLAAADSIFSLLDEEEEQDTGTVEDIQLNGDIVFSAVSFGYPNTESLALNEVSLTIPAGKTVAMVGESGSGKSTLANLIPRFFSPNHGTIRIGGTDINTIKLATLRQQISFVSQDTVLFHDSVTANIAYGALADALPDDIQQASTTAKAQEFIERLEQGFDTNIGTGGTRLSGGQRQRLAIARALLKPAPILIMDEATSALDQNLEKQVQTALDQHHNGQTRIIITHRLAAISHIEHIFVFDHGKLVEQGNHASLMALDGYYARLVNAAGRENSP
jgi:ATP-binding cassette, subfamily B, bacterial MsbA